MNRIASLPTAAAALFVMAFPAGAVTVDGTLDPGYGPALVVQTVQTGLSGGQITGDNSDGDLDFANGSELDAAHAHIADGALHLFLAGNLAMRLNTQQTQTIAHRLDLFIDAVPGGQGTLMVGPGDPINGLTFDAGFEADYWFQLEGDGNGGGGGPPDPFWIVRHAALPPFGTGSLATLGIATAGSGALGGGSNPHGVQATIDNRNILGVTFGCDGASGAGVTTGSEWRIPLAAIGNPAGCIRITLLIRNGSSSVSNQTLGPVPGGTCPLGSASTVSFAAIAGEQHFTVCPATTDVGPAAAHGLSLRLLGPSPSRGDRVRVAFALPADGPADLRLIDGAGRRLAAGTLGRGAGRSGTFELSLERALAPGVYWIRLGQGGRVAVRKFAVVR